MEFAKGMIYGAGFTTAALIILAIARVVFHLGVC